MRDRLIELIKQAKKQTKNANCDIERNMIFADYLLENGVIVLPQTVYWYDMGGNLKEATVKNKFFAELKNGFEYDVSYDEIGKTVFLTREEAEQALKGGAE